VETLRGVVVSVEMNRKHVRGVEKFGEERKMRSAPALADNLVRVRHDDLMEGSTGESTVRDCRPGRAFIAGFPRFGNRSLGQASLAEPFRDQAFAKGIGSNVAGHL
jgi:hypothetical protein